MADSVQCNSIECNFIKCNSHETSNLDNKQFRLNKKNEIKDYFIAERESMSKRLSKYIASFDFFDKSLISYQQLAVAFLLHHLQQLLKHL